jgi:signal transduction histidine kinase
VSLRARFARSAAATVPIALAFAGLALVEISYFPGRDSRLHEAALRAKAVALAELTASSVAPALDFEDEGVLAEFLGRVARDPDVAGVAACGAEGKVLHEVGHGASTHGCPPTSATQVVLHVNSLTVATPILAKARPGTLVISFKTEAIVRARSDAERVALAIAGGILLLGLGVSWRIARMLSRLQTLVEENRAARARAEAASEAKSAFLANMSHEIRTPMNGVIGVTQLLERSQLDDEQRRHVRTIARSGELLLAVINDILDFSKVEAGRLTIVSGSLELRALVSEVCDSVRLDAQRKGLILQHDIAVDVPRRARGDDLRLRQVLLNLVSNAIKFTQVGRVNVVLRRTPKDDGVRFEVSDTGIGIAPEHHAHLFEAFTQVDELSTRRYGGTGLGLAICKRLVTLMHGTIGVTSSEGKGSTFWFELPLSPLADEPRSSVAPEAKASAKPQAGGVRLLAVDDNEINRGVMEHMAQTLGYPIDLVEGGREAVDKITRGAPYAMILMDCQMPDVDGYMATGQIRAWERSRHTARRIPIIAVTAHALGSEREKVLAAGMNDYLAKPVRLNALREMIEKWLRTAVN